MNFFEEIEGLAGEIEDLFIHNGTPDIIKNIIKLWHIYSGEVSNSTSQGTIHYFLYCGWEDIGSEWNPSQRYKDVSRHHVHIFYSNDSNEWFYIIKDCSTDDCLNPNLNRLSKSERVSVPIYETVSAQTYVSRMQSELQCRTNESLFVHAQILKLISVWINNGGDVIDTKENQIFTFFLLCGKGGWGTEGSKRYIQTTNNYVKIVGNSSGGWYVYIKNVKNQINQETLYGQFDLRFNYKKSLDFIYSIFKC